MENTMSTPEELAELLESEDMETEIVAVSGAIVIDSKYRAQFIESITQLFDEYVYLDDNYHLEVKGDLEQQAYRQTVDNISKNLGENK